VAERRIFLPVVTDASAIQLKLSAADVEFGRFSHYCVFRLDPGSDEFDHLVDGNFWLPKQAMTSAGVVEKRRFSLFPPQR